MRVLVVIAKAEFKLKYSGSALGYVWSVLKPLSCSRFCTSSSVGSSPGTISPYYAVSLLVGIVLFTFFATRQARA